MAWGTSKSEILFLPNAFENRQLQDPAEGWHGCPKIRLLGISGPLDSTLLWRFPATELKYDVPSMPHPINIPEGAIREEIAIVRSTASRRHPAGAPCRPVGSAIADDHHKR